MFNKRRKNTEAPEINSSSMADIAFLLLVFFLVATQIPVKDEGIKFVLPKKMEEQQEPVPIPERNLLIVKVNTINKLFVEDGPEEFDRLRARAKEFLSNPKRDPNLSESPNKAVISLRVDRGTKHRYAVLALDELKGAYNELRAEYLGMSVEEYLALDSEDRKESMLIKKAKDKYPMKLSKAEPTHVTEY